MFSKQRVPWMPIRETRQKTIVFDKPSFDLVCPNSGCISKAPLSKRVFAAKRSHASGPAVEVRNDDRLMSGGLQR